MVCFIRSGPNIFLWLLFRCGLTVRLTVVVVAQSVVLLV